ncbi:MAG TPA: hypothetical protein VFZ65_23615 [Planctomycetota bacterium]|nr:hypothetical protein [Planctomycetota bacterium]
MNEFEPGRDERRDEQLDAALRSAFAPPPAAVFAAQARTVSAARVRRPAWPWLLAAAALLVTAWFAIDRARRQPVAQQLGALWVAAYEHALTSGFDGGSCCEPTFDLAKACQDQFAAKLGVHADAVKLLGCYCGLPTGGCMALLARAGTSPVGIYVVAAGHDPHPQLPPGSALHLARREMGALVLYALSESAAADALAGFFVPSN